MILEELADRGFDPIAAYDGRAGLVAILEQSPDLVLCNVGLPVMSGIQLLERLSSAVPRHAPFVFLTGLAEREVELRVRHLGAPDVVRKPVDFDLLAQIIDARLSATAPKSGRSGPG